MVRFPLVVRLAAVPFRPVTFSRLESLKAVKLKPGGSRKPASSVSFKRVMFSRRAVVLPIKKEVLFRRNVAFLNAAAHGL